jgi:hypothetical protein
VRSAVDANVCHKAPAPAATTRTKVAEPAANNTSGFPRERRGVGVAIFNNLSI